MGGWMDGWHTHTMSQSPCSLLSALFSWIMAIRAINIRIRNYISMKWQPKNIAWCPSGRSKWIYAFSLHEKGKRKQTALESKFSNRMGVKWLFSESSNSNRYTILCMNGLVAGNFRCPHKRWNGRLRYATMEIISHWFLSLHSTQFTRIMRKFLRLFEWKRTQLGQRRQKK